MKPVLVTRAEPGASKTVARLQARGVQAMNAATAHIVFLDARLDLTGVHTLVFTSVNAVRAFCRQSQARGFKVYTVGDRTAEAARSAGFADILSAGGDGAALAARLISERPTGRILHVRGQDIAFDLAAALAAENLLIEDAVLYRAEPVNALSEEVLGALGKDSVILIYSAKGAERLIKLVDQSAICKACIVAISQGAAAPFTGVETGKITIADHPDESRVFAALDGVLERG